MFDGDFAAGDGDVAPQPRFACQQVVVGRIEPPLGYIVTDGKQSSIGIIQEAHVDRCVRCAHVLSKLFAQPKHLSGQPFRCGERLQQSIDPIPDGGLRSGRSFAKNHERLNAGNLPFRQIGKAGRLTQRVHKDRQPGCQR